MWNDELPIQVLFEALAAEQRLRRVFIHLNMAVVLRRYVDSTRATAPASLSQLPRLLFELSAAGAGSGRRTSPGGCSRNSPTRR